MLSEEVFFRKQAMLRMPEQINRNLSLQLAGTEVIFISITITEGF